MDQAYFDREVAYDVETIDRFESKLTASTAPAGNRARLAYSIFRKRYESIVMRYSWGEPVSQLKTSFPAVIESWERYLGMEGHQPQAALDKDAGDYVRALWLVSLAIIFEVPDELFARLLACIGTPGQDSLLERLAGTRVPNQPDPGRLLWPKPYEPLYRAIDAPAEERPKLFQTFLRSWYASMGKLDVYWHDNHRGPEGGGFFGYWCIEAAGVVVAFGIDDAPFREMPYYPRDLAHRSHG